MKKLLLYLVLAVVTSLSMFTHQAQAQPYDCTSCLLPFDIRNSLFGMLYLEGRLGNPYSYSGDISDNNEAAWDAVVWTDGLRSKPSFEDLTNSFVHDYGAQYRAIAPYLYDASSSVQDDIQAVESEVMDMETSVSGKMDVPSGTTSQYVRGDGSLASFPSIPAAQVNSDWSASSGVAQILNKPSLASVATSGAYNDLSGKPSLGTSAALNVAAAGDAASGEVVKGSDTRLTDSRTPLSHTHAAADITSGTKTSAFISDFAEAAQDNVLGVVSTGPGLSYTYNDAGNAASISLASKTYQTPTFSSATSATRLSTTVEADVFYAFDATVTISLLAGQSVTAVLKYADDSGMSSNVVTVDSAKTANSGVLNLTQTNTLRVGGKIPAGKYRQVTFVTAGSGVAAPSAIAAGQEVF